MKTLVILSLVASVAVAERVSYDGFKVFRLTPTPNLDVPALEAVLQAIEYDQWNKDTNDLTIAVAPNQVAGFLSLGLEATVMHEDLGRSIADEGRSRGPAWNRRRQVDDLSWYQSYHDYSEHVAYFEELHAAYPNNTELVSTGTSYEGRDLFGLHIWGADGPGKPAVLWHGTVHAREWISAPVVEYLTLQLLSGYGQDAEVTALVDRYDYWIFPFVNPDGFVHTQTTDRLWRKNRQPPPCSSNSTCYGRDINRNWPYKWDASVNPGGASGNPCSQTYRGERAGDTPEMAGMHALVDKLRDGPGIQLFIDWHSFSQFLLAPVGYDCRRYVPTLGEHIYVAHQASRAIRGVEGTQFVFGPSCSVLYASTGYSIDYAYEVGGAKYAYLIELRDTGNYGFVLPPEQILGSAREQWAGMRVMLGLLDRPIFG
ncbi:carboxypeptidase A5 [Plectosphaerella cucumerina]|uniref:Carboxypeptidase A5 n=1 Tax=Plectosphaerella cucumerina TaxID=40658 RepID=A0A8K0X8C3_9PEZI|nr:carboxypeptidase A5 [Plectosphaerella cucumerina]